jgi:hypothetical protein
VKALLYTLTLLLFSLGASASEQSRDEALPVSHIDISSLSAVLDPTPVSGADRVPAAIALVTLFELSGTAPAPCCLSAKVASITGIHAIRAPPLSLSML